MGVKEKNLEKILRMLQCHGSLNINAVMKALALSEATVRRYFADMEHSGQAFRFHGGIRLVADRGNSGYHFHEAASTYTAEKHLIGSKAAALICDHDRLFFDSGTTVLECGNALAELLGTKKINDLRIVTNSLAFGEGLTPHCPVVLTGGMIRPSRMDLCGNVALENVRRYNFTKAFLGTDAISPQGVLSTTDEETSGIAAAVLEHSSNIYILADSSKLGKNAFVPYGTLFCSRVTLITDSLADKEMLSGWRKAGVNIVTVYEN
ncbi:MAG: DeoR/GlpR transcriptional regulator [Lentisphaeria bacterium]|nr:DeoR/GlpR transcriptional regulator [Lentisphaeria bacterium]